MQAAGQPGKWHLSRALGILEVTIFQGFDEVERRIYKDGPNSLNAFLKASFTLT